MDIHSPCVVATSKVCGSWVDVFVQKGFKVRGTATSVTQDAPAFQTLAAPLEALAQGRFPIQSVFLVQVQFIEQIIAPSYRFFPGETTEEAQIASAMRAYGVAQSAKTAV